MSIIGIYDNYVLSHITAAKNNRARFTRFPFDNIAGRQLNPAIQRNPKAAPWECGVRNATVAHRKLHGRRDSTMNVSDKSLRSFAQTRHFVRCISGLMVDDHSLTYTIYAMADSDALLGRTRGATRLTELPTEVLSNICQLLCLHCRSEHMVDLERNVISAAHDDQRTLARLARTCKRFREIAQPVLFHWYHSGYLPFKESSSIEWKQHPDMNPTGGGNDQLLPFLRSVTGQPALAAAVRTFSLVTINQRFQAKAEEKLWSDMNRAVELHVNQQQQFNYRGLDCAVPLVLPNITQCFILCGRGPCLYHDLRSSPARLYGLTYLALSPWPDYMNYDLLDLIDLLACMPNLETLIAPDCGSTTTWDNYLALPHGKWGLQLDKLRSLSISDVDPEVLHSFLRCCPALEDLEIFCDFNGEYPRPTLRHFEHVKEKLRRFCYSATSPYMQDRNWIEEDDSEEDRDMAHVLSRSFKTPIYLFVNTPEDPEPTKTYGPFDCSGYSCLEILEIEQLLLYGPVFTRDTRAEAFAASADSGPDAFMSRIPSSLRVLHVGMVVAWPELRRDLAGLARAVGTRFPYLHTVRVDTFQGQCHGPLSADEVREMEVLLGSVGVAFSVGATPDGSSPRGMLGPRPGQPETWRVLPVLYGLDGEVKR